MSVLTPSPPSILGGVIPHPGLAPSSRQSLMLNGWAGLAADLGPALTDAVIRFNIDGTSTITLSIEDDHRTLLRSPVLTSKSYVDVDGITFELSSVAKTGPSLNIIFDHEVVAKLKSHTDTVVVAAGTTTRTGFCRRLAASEPWITVSTPDGDSPDTVLSQLTVGNVDPSTGLPAPPVVSTVAQPPESYWDAMGKTLDAIGWRRFPQGQSTLLLVPDEWLFTQASSYTFDESSPGVDTIDFTYDSRQPLGALSITCRAEAWAFPVGTIITIQNCGIANGTWLVSDITRSLMSPTAKVTAAKPETTIPESSISSGGSLTDAQQIANFLATGQLPGGSSSTSPSASSSSPSSSSSYASGSLPASAGVSRQVNQTLGQVAAAQRGWTGSQWIALNNVVMAESGWSASAENPSSGAYGIPQALPGSKMASSGADWKTNPSTQIAWLLDYIAQRYGNPQNAWTFHLAHGWY